MPLCLPKHYHSIVRHSPIGLSLQESSCQAASCCGRFRRYRVEPCGCGYGSDGHGILVACHAGPRVCLHQYAPSVAFLAVASFAARRYVRTGEAYGAFLMQDSCNHHHDLRQQQCAEYSLGTLFLAPRYGLLQSGLPMEHQVFLARTEHGGAGGAACPGEPWQRAWPSARRIPQDDAFYVVRDFPAAFRLRTCGAGVH